MRFPALALLATLAITPAGCTGVFLSATGDVMSSYAREHQIPYLMKSSDVGASATVGTAFAGFMAAFGGVTDTPDRAALLSYMSAGMGAELEIWETELRYLRALRRADVPDAQDAEVLLERQHTTAALRYALAYEHFVAHFQPPATGCPEIDPEDELFYVLGLASGLLAVFHDRGAHGMAGVSLAIPPLLARAAGCVDSAKWWGLPAALQASVWLTVPGSAPEGTDPLAVLRDAVTVGDQAHVRMARAMQILAFEGLGDDERIAAAIPAHAAEIAAHPAEPRYRMLDVYAAEMTRHASDRIWTRETGHRAPTDDFGRLPAPPTTDEADDDLLDGLDLDE